METRVALKTGVLVVGCGPAGLAPLIAASARGLLPDILRHGLVLVERSDRLGDGRLGHYVINSDSPAQSFLSCLSGDHDPRICALTSHPVALEIARFGRETVPLALVGELLRLIGAALADIVAEAPAGQVMTGCEAMSTRRQADGWLTRLRCLSTGRITEIASRVLLIATGGQQTDDWLERTTVSGQALLPTYAGRVRHSDDVMTSAGLADITARLAPLPTPKVAVIGGGSSAVACARVLLEPGRLPPGSSVTLMHRSRLSLFYLSAEAAMADGYAEFGREDICPVSGFVFRFGGLRFDSRTVVRTMLGLGDDEPDPRLRLHRLQSGDGFASHAEAEAWGQDRRLLDQADLIVSCIGYRPRGLPMRDVDGSVLELAADQPGGVLIGPGCDVLDASGEPLGGVFAIGLAAGFRPAKALGGEPSFSGQVNGLWLWQNDVGLMIAERLLAVLEAPAHAAMTSAISSTQRDVTWHLDPATIGARTDPVESAVMEA